jgi:hypothetical protein
LAKEKIGRYGSPKSRTNHSHKERFAHPPDFYRSERHPPEVESVADFLKHEQMCLQSTSSAVELLQSVPCVQARGISLGYRKQHVNLTAVNPDQPIKLEDLKLPTPLEEELRKEEWYQKVRKQSASLFDPQGEKSLLHVTSYEITEEDGKYYLYYYFVAKSALKMLYLAEDYWRHDWRILTIGTPGHVAVALWQPKERYAEVFDSSGEHEDTIHQKHILEDVLPGGTRIHFVNDQFLQQEDVYCQTWIWYYALNRLLPSESKTRYASTAKAIVRRLQLMSPKERFHEIQTFWTKLLYHPKTLKKFAKYHLRRRL